MIDNSATPELRTSPSALSSSYARPRVDGVFSIVSLEQVGATAWDDFVNHSEGSLPTQAACWESILCKTYSFSCHFLAAQQDGEVQGILPLYRIKSPLTGDSLQSMSGAVCAATSQAAQVLLSAADELARLLDVDYLLLRDSRQAWDNCGLEVLEAHRGVRLHLPAGCETAWKNLHKDLRHHIRNGERKGDIDIIVDQPRVDDLYDVLLQGNHQMGTPLYSKQFLINVTQGFPGRFNIALGYHGGKPIVGYFNLIQGTTLFGLWGTVLHSQLSLMPNHRVYWRIFAQAIQQGLNVVDLGRSPFPSSQFDFKAKWGDETYPIYQLFHIYHGKTPPTLNVSQAVRSNGQLSFFSRLWSRLPLPLARSLGPILRRHIPFG